MSYPTVRMKFALSANDGGAWGEEPDSDAATPVLRSTEIMLDGRIEPEEAALRKLTSRELRTTSLRVGDILVVKSSGSDAHLGKSGWADERCAGMSFSNFIQRLRVSRNFDPRYTWYCMNCTATKEQVRVLSSTTTGLQNLSGSLIREIEIPKPSLEEQRRIAGFLDAEIARVDAFRASRLAQTKILDELEIARIGKHLSTAETLGPVYAYFDVQLGKMLNAERASGGSQQPYLRNANVHWYQIETEDLATMAFEPYERPRYGLRAGDLLVCEGGNVGESAVWDGRMPTCFYQKSLHRVRPRGNVPAEWLMYWLRYANATGVFQADGNLTTIPHLTGEQLAEYRIPIPEDGHRHVAELSSEIAAIREMQRKMAAADALLAERRQALITAAVTGQIDVTTVRGAAV